VLGGAGPAVLRGLVAEQDDAALAQHAEGSAERTGGRRRLAPSTLGRPPRRLDLPREKDAARLGAGPARRRPRP
jgi:hypothetical protein